MRAVAHFSRNRSCPVVVVVLLLLAQSSAADVITVEGDCTLVDAIRAANLDVAAGGCPAGSGTDQIVLTEDVSLTEVASSTQFGDNGTPIVTSEIAIVGNGFVIERAAGAPTFRIFEVHASGSLSLHSVEVRNGFQVGLGAGGIKNVGTLTLTNTTVANSYGSVGAIENRGVATIRSSTIADGDGQDAGIRNYEGTLSLVDTTVSGNDGTYTGGVVNEDGTVYITASRIVNNHGYDGTGGVENEIDGTMFIVNSTIADNLTSFGEGGISNQSYLHVSGSTVSGNQGGNVGGVSSSGGSMVLVNSTVSGNVSDGPYAVFDMGSSGYLENVTIAGNSGTEAFYCCEETVFLRNVVIGHTIGSDNCHPFFAGAVDLGGNLSDDDSCPAFFGELTGLDPVLTDNGGPTETHALLPGSSAIDTGGACGLAPDQRGFLRDAVCDSGAFEFAATEAVGGLLTGLEGRRVSCENKTTGQSVEIALGGGKTWNCTAAGLVVVPGDRLLQRVSGQADASSTAGGSVAGQSAQKVLCRNLTTGEEAVFDPPGPAWSCADELSEVSPGDLIVQRITGAVP